MERLTEAVRFNACALERAQRLGYAKDERRLAGKAQGLETILGFVAQGDVSVEAVKLHADRIARRESQASRNGHEETAAKLNGELSGVQQALGIIIAGE